MGGELCRRAPGARLAGANYADYVRVRHPTVTASDDVLVQRRPGGVGIWTNIVTWRPPGTYDISDRSSNAVGTQQYRVLCRSPTTGARSRGKPVALGPA